MCTDISGNTPGCDTLLTPGLATYCALSTLSSNGDRNYFDSRRVAVSLYDPTVGTFYTSDNPATALLKMISIDLKVPGGLAGAYVWVLKDDDANGTMVKPWPQVWVARIAQLSSTRSINAGSSPGGLPYIWGPADSEGFRVRPPPPRGVLKAERMI